MWLCRSYSKLGSRGAFKLSYDKLGLEYAVSKHFLMLKFAFLKQKLFHPCEITFASLGLELIDQDQVTQLSSGQGFLSNKSKEMYRSGNWSDIFFKRSTWMNLAGPSVMWSKCWFCRTFEKLGMRFSLQPFTEVLLCVLGTNSLNITIVMKTSRRITLKQMLILRPASRKKKNYFNKWI